MHKYRFEYFASCPSGLEELLSREILDFGAKNVTTARGGVKFESFHEVALKVILFSRVASRVFKFLYSFEVRDEKDFYLEATHIKWKSIMDVQQTFRLHTIYGDLSKFRQEFINSQFTTLKFKDAIVDYFRHHVGSRPSVSKEFPDVSLLLRIDPVTDFEDVYLATILVDLCGDPLNQRGYRVAKTEAPVKENLAAGIIQLIQWNPKTESFLDAMTGSGTFVIEAALIAGNIPPSYLKVKELKNNPGLKPWNFLKSQWFQKDEFLQENYKNYLKEITDLTEKGLSILRKMKIEIMGNEISDMVLFSTKENIKKAGLEGIIKITKGDAVATQPLNGKTLFFCNPPYGERLETGRDEYLGELYKKLGDHWKNTFKDHRAALMTGNIDLLKKVGLRTSKKHILYNGDIECRVAEYQLY